MTDKSHKIAILPGDGIGPEVMAQAQKVLDAIEKKHGIQFIREEHEECGIAIDNMVVRYQKLLSKRVKKPMQFCLVQ